VEEKKYFLRSVSLYFLCLLNHRVLKFTFKATVFSVCIAWVDSETVYFAHTDYLNTSYVSYNKNDYFLVKID
jgi:hypothetical protein